MFAKLSVVWFVAAFAVGMLVCYLQEPRRKVVMRFPTPHDSQSIVYRAGGDAEHDPRHESCYRIRSTKVACPTDGANVLPQPLYSIDGFVEKTTRG
jgi:hypothetical protein